MTRTISRSKFVEGVEHAITAASDKLSLAEKIALRAVAATIPEVEIASFSHGAKCPLGQIGITSEVSRKRGLDEFWRAFDHFMINYSKLPHRGSKMLVWAVKVID